MSDKAVNLINVSTTNSNGWFFNVSGTRDSLQIKTPSLSEVNTMENLISFKDTLSEVVSKALDQSLGIEEIAEEVIEEDIDFVGPCYAPQGV